MSRPSGPKFGEELDAEGERSRENGIVKCFTPVVASKRKALGGQDNSIKPVEPTVLVPEVRWSVLVSHYNEREPHLDDKVRNLT